MEKQITISEVVNAFTPAREISNSERFAGRKKYVQDSYYSLVSEGANLAIVGGRGIGKSSLARQIQNIAQGDNSLLDKLDIYCDSTLDFLPIYLACGNNIKSTKDLLLRLLSRRDCLREWIYEVPSARKEFEKISGGIDVKVASVGGELSAEKMTKPAIQTHDVESVFENVVTEVLNAKIAKNGLLIIIDEFDQVQDPSGFAGLLKSLATNAPGVKFCLVGVAQDIHKLMKEHKSADRLFAGGVINLPFMNEVELEEIILNAEHSVRQHITFDVSGKLELVRLANGHPYIVHLIGQQAYRSAYLEPEYTLSSGFITRTLDDIARKEADPVLEGRYKRAVASSYQREAVLKSLAFTVQDDHEVWTTDAYRMALDYDVENASRYVANLVTDDFGAELVKVRERYYRFKDSLFATYVKIRPWLIKPMQYR